METTEQIASDAVPVWDKPVLPIDAELIVLVNEENFDFGGTIQNAYRLPLERIAANNALQGNTAVIYSPNADISIPEGKVVPAYVESFDPHLTKRAQASSETTKAQFLIIGRTQNVDDSYDVQSSGFYKFPVDHTYEVGQVYYLSDSAPGGVTTEAPTSSTVQKLFTVLDSKTIQINLEG